MRLPLGGTPGSGSPSLAPDNPTPHPSYSRTASRTFARIVALRASGRLSQLATISARSSESPYSSGTLPGCGDLCCLCPDVCGLCCGGSSFGTPPPLCCAGSVLDLFGFCEGCVRDSGRRAVEVLARVVIGGNAGVVAGGPLGDFPRKFANRSSRPIEPGQAPVVGPQPVSQPPPARPRIGAALPRWTRIRAPRRGPRRHNPHPRSGRE